MGVLSSDDRGMGSSKVKNIGKDKTKSDEMDDEMRVEEKIYMRQRGVVRTYLT